MEVVSILIVVYVQVIIWVELTKTQRSYYKACYEGEIGTLLKGVKRGNLPNMRNVVSSPAVVCFLVFSFRNKVNSSEKRRSSEMVVSLQAGVQTIDHKNPLIVCPACIRPAHSFSDQVTKTARVAYRIALLDCVLEDRGTSVRMLFFSMFQRSMCRIAARCSLSFPACARPWSCASCATTRS
jgi:hypothetical protein